MSDNTQQTTSATDRASDRQSRGSTPAPSGGGGGSRTGLNAQLKKLSYDDAVQLLAPGDGPGQPGVAPAMGAATAEPGGGAAREAAPEASAPPAKEPESAAPAQAAERNAGAAGPLTKRRLRSAIRFNKLKSRWRHKARWARLEAALGLSVTGVPTEQSVGAVARFQKQEGGLTVDGKVGGATIKRLEPVVEAKAEGADDDSEAASERPAEAATTAASPGTNPATTALAGEGKGSEVKPHGAAPAEKEPAAAVDAAPGVNSAVPEPAAAGDKGSTKRPQGILGKARALQSRKESAKTRMYRGVLVATPVLGAGFNGGVNPTMHEALTKAHNSLLGRLRHAIATEAASGQAVKSRLDGSDIKAADNEGLRHWLGMRQAHLGYSTKHAPRSYHKTGSAVDINYTTNPWTAVRTGKAVGGEGGGKFGINKNAVLAIDRAMAFMKAGAADIHAELRPDGLTEQQRRQWASDQWERFSKVSHTVSDYSALVYDRAKARTELVENGPRKVLLSWYGSKLSARSKKAAASPLDESVSLAAIQKVIDTKHGGKWDKTAKDMREQIQTDFHLIARSMVRGKQTEKPSHTRNPLVGTFDLAKELVEELVAAGLRWGACELGRNSGDMMHFDLGVTPKYEAEKKKLDAIKAERKAAKERQRASAK